MIRPLTCACMMLAGISGLYLYQVKHRAQMLDQRIEHVVHQTDAARERTRLLRAEWALLNEPERLQQLSEHFLHLQPMAPSQFVQMSDLAARLPAVPPPEAAVASTDGGAPADSGETDTDDDIADRGTAQSEPAPNSGPAPQIAAAPRATHTEHLARIEHDSSQGARRMVAHAETRPANRPDTHERIATVAHTDERERFAAPREPVTRRTAMAHPVPLAAPRPVHAGMMTAMALPSATSRPRYETVEAYVPARPLPMASSSLGMARTMLPPPVPVAPSAFR